MAEANRGVQHGWQPESKNQYNLEVDRGVEESGCKRRSPSLRGRQNRLFPVAETLRQPGCRHPMQRGAFQEKKEKEKEVSHPSRRSVANRNAKQRAAHTTTTLAKAAHKRKEPASRERAKGAAVSRPALSSKRQAALTVSRTGKKAGRDPK